MKSKLVIGSSNTDMVIKTDRLPNPGVDSKGKSSRVTAPGSNSYLNEEDIPVKIFDNDKFEILLLQMEIPDRTIEYSAMSAWANGIKVILNPAPVAKSYAHFSFITASYHS